MPRRKIWSVITDRPPALDLGNPPDDLGSALPPLALERWNAGIRAASDGDNDVISIYEMIGEDFWSGGGMTSSRMAGLLRKLEGRDIEVHINSPGGDMFEGISIYNQLREHKGHVTVKVMGLAASAASIIAMAGDEVRMGAASFLMVHNCWVVAIGNRHDMREVADFLEPFDAAMADVYAMRSGTSKDKVEGWMDAETFINGTQAVEWGLADSLFDKDEVTVDPVAKAEAAKVHAIRRVDNALARSGLPRSERKRLLNEIKGGMPGAAADDAMPGAGDFGDWTAAAARLLTTLQT